MSNCQKDVYADAFTEGFLKGWEAALTHFDKIMSAHTLFENEHNPNVNFQFNDEHPYDTMDSHTETVNVSTHTNIV